MNKKLISFCMSVVMTFTMVLPCFAAEQSGMILFADEVQTEFDETDQLYEIEFDETDQLYETEFDDEVNVMADEVILDEAVSDEAVSDEDTSLNEVWFEEDESYFPEEFLSDKNTEELTNALKTVKEISDKLNKNGENVATLSEAFNSFLNVANSANTIFAVVNNSVSVLRLIGVVEDPTQKKLDTISDQISSLDEKVTAMAKSISDLSDSMNKLSADVGLSARASSAASLQQNWNSFNTNYVDKGLQPLITQYESKIIDKALQWCYKTPDNARIVINYKKVSGSYEPVYGEASKDADAIVTLPRECLPASIPWNVDTYSYTMAQAIKESLSNNLSKATCTGGFTVTNANVGEVANDAVNALLYDMSVQIVNENGSAFAMQVRDAYANYCKYLTMVKDTGVSAMIQSMYRTHAFESQTKADIVSFYDKMIVEAGAYGSFALNILGMSNSITTNDKENAAALFCTTIDNLKSGKSGSLTGKDNYCYINNGLFAIGEITFEGSVSARTKEWWVFGDKRKYESAKGWGPSIKSLKVGGKEYKDNTGVAAVGDSNAIMIVNTLLQNGDLDIVKNQLTTPTVEGNKYRCVTSLAEQASLPIDDSVNLRRFRCIGNWYGNSNSTTLGSSNRGSNAAFRHRSKIDGSVMDVASTAIKSNTTLSAVAAFGENSRAWSIDEVYLFWGPATGNMIKFTEQWPKETSQGDYHWYDGDFEQTYKIMLSMPYDKSSAMREYKDQIIEHIDYVETIAPTPTPTPTPEPTPEEPKFLDVSENKWYGKKGGAIDFVVSNNIMAGTGENKFSPDVDCDRAMMAKIIYNCEKDPVAAKTNPFKDVKKKWYYDAVTWAAENNITKGISATTFGINSKLTREQVAQFLFNYAQFLKFDTKSDADLSKYPDADKISSWAIDAMKWANANSIVAGKSNDGQNYLDPTGNATRAEVAQMIKNFFDKFGD